jgi:hypothetical protein
MIRKVQVVGIVFVLSVCFYIAYSLGRHQESKITTFSDLVQKTQGRRSYIIDMEVTCSNGKDLGKLQVDLDLTNGRLRVVRNDSKLAPNCDK